MNSGRTENGKPTTAGNALHLLCSRLSAGLHLAAQPLTILCASLSSEFTEGMDETGLRELVTSSASEVARLSRVFDAMRELVHAEDSRAELTEVSLLPVLEDAIERVGPLYRQERMNLRFDAPAQIPEVLVHPDRAGQAISAVLLSARSLAQQGQTIHMVARNSTDCAEVEVLNGSCFSDALNAEASLHMAVAEANMRMQDGEIGWNLRPFAACIQFKRASCTS